MVETIKFLMAVQNALRSAGIYVNTATATEVARSLNESGMVVGERRTDGELAGLDERVLAYENEIELLKNVIEGLRQAPVERFLFQDGKIIPLNRWEWISVKDRLPEVATTHNTRWDKSTDSIRVLCACVQADGKKMVKEGYCKVYSDGYVHWKIPGTIHSVTHWMPLPEPPKGE